MPTPYFVILDNSLIDEPLKPDLPYWAFPLKRLPTRKTAERFIDDVLYQSERWANAASGDDWVSLRLLQRYRMCPRCGHLLVTMGQESDAPIHVVWYVARNPQPEVMGHDAAFHLGMWHEAYVQHRCQENFFAAASDAPTVGDSRED